MKTGHDIPAAFKSGSSTRSKLKTSHLQLVSGEETLFSTTKNTNLYGCGIVRLEDTMAVTDQRVLYLNRQWVLGCCAATREEAFFLNDLQSVNQLRLVAFRWAALAITCLCVGARLLRAADEYKGMYDDYYPKASDTSSMLGSNYLSSHRGTADNYANGAYIAAVVFGILILMMGIAALMVFLAKHIHRGVYLNLNFSRKDCGILDWQPESYWRPRISSTRRTIKLPKEMSQEAYNLLSELLHAKFSMRAGDARGGAGNVA